LYELRNKTKWIFNTLQLPRWSLMCNSRSLLWHVKFILIKQPTATSIHIVYCSSWGTNIVINQIGCITKIFKHWSCTSNFRNQW